MEILNLAGGTLSQKHFDKVGDGLPYQKLFLEKGIHSAPVPYKLNDGTIITAEEGAVIELPKHANRDLFKSMVPVLGQKKNTIKNILVENVTFKGNAPYQDVSYGKGFDNFCWFQNVSNLTVRNITVQDSQGDGVRVTNGKDIEYYKNKVIRCGHDGFYGDGVVGVIAWGNYTELRTNSAIRLRHVKNGHVYNNVTVNKVAGVASSPGFQIEVSTEGMVGSGIVLENNTFEGTYGPAIWAICTNNADRTAASGLTIANNYFHNCGGMQHIAGVGGVVCDGWDDVLISKNVFSGCKGYGVLFGNYRGSSSGSGYTADVNDNIFVNTEKSKTAGSYSGTAVCNLLGSKYSVVSRGNHFFNNVRDHYGVSASSNFFPDTQPVLPQPPTTDPGIVETPTEPDLPETPAFLMASCTESQLGMIQERYPELNILRRYEK